MYSYDNASGSAYQMIDLLGKLKPKREWAQRSNDWLAGLTSINQQVRHAHCGDYLTMLANEDLSRRKVEKAFFCKLRLCPGCAWRASLRAATAVSAIAQELQAQRRVMLLVTLTVPNVPGDKLRNACIQLGQAWARMCKRKTYAVWADNIRKLKITYNVRCNDYHPYMHVIVFVRPKYFGGNGGYISQAKLLTDWRRATGMDAITQVDIRRCRDKSGWAQVVFKVAKYTVQVSDFCHSEPVFRTFWRATDHIRSITFAGVCKALKADYDAGKLDKWLPTDTTRYVWRLVYQYHEDLGYVHKDTEAYAPPVSAGFSELVNDVMP